MRGNRFSKRVDLIDRKYYRTMSIIRFSNYHNRRFVLGANYHETVLNERRKTKNYNFDTIHYRLREILKYLQPN